jgi:uncharacterized protein (DUF4415 family)
MGHPALNLAARQRNAQPLQWEGGRVAPWFKCSLRNITSWHEGAYNYVMTAKTKKTKRRTLQSRRVARLHGSIEDDLFSLADGETEAEPRWNRPRKQRISLRVDCEVVDWFKSKGPGYQTRINRILRRVMMEGKKRELPHSSQNRA